MKNIIIAGVSRAGKSTLAKKIAKEYQMTYIPFDSIVSTLENLYPEIGIAHMDENIQMSKRIAVLLEEFVKHLEYEGINYVIDLYQVFPDDLKAVGIMDSHIVIYLGYSSLHSKEKLGFVRKYAREKDWTMQVDDAEMMGILDLFIKESKLMQMQCVCQGIQFFDTGTSFNDSIDRAYEYMSKTLYE